MPFFQDIPYFRLEVIYAPSLSFANPPKKENNF
jgi:hypothetical protein